MRKPILAVLIGFIALAGTASAYCFAEASTQEKAALMQATADGDYEFALQMAEEYECEYVYTQEEFEMHGEMLNAFVERDYKRVIELREQMREQKHAQKAEIHAERAGVREEFKQAIQNKDWEAAKQIREENDFFGVGKMLRGIHARIGNAFNWQGK